jgi:putative DNA primase/helicase
MPSDTFTQTNLNGVRPAVRAARESLTEATLELSSAPAEVRAELFDRYAYRMGELIDAGLLEPPEVGDLLTSAADANGLTTEIGADAVQEALAAGLIAGSQSAAALKLVWSQPQVVERPAQPEDEIERLALLGAFEYERVRDAEAKRLKVRVSVLDEQVGRRRKAEEQQQDKGQAGFLQPPAPWPIPVECASLLDELAHALRSYVKLREDAVTAICLWVVHAHAIACTEIAPVLAIESPEKRCGKTTLLSVIQSLVPKALTAANMSSAAVFRAVQAFGPTLIIDEADTFLTPEKPDLIGILNSSHVRATAYVVRVVGDNHEVKTFSTWCAKAIALIGGLPATLQDRSIIVRMRRKQREESVERLRLDRVSALRELCSKAARWVADHAEALRSCDPAVPPELNDRAADNWRPLLAIADMAGGAWPATARSAARCLSGSSQDDEDLSKGVLLLRDCQRAFKKTGASELGAEQLVTCLCGLDEAPWAEWRRGEKPITARGVAVLLKAFGIASKHTRTAREYHKSDFADAWKRYLPLPTSDATVTSVNALRDKDNVGPASVTP